jgi:hypothetical protein
MKALTQFIVFLGMSLLTPALAQAPFTRITVGEIVTDQEASVAGAWTDYDNDGFIDLFVPNILWAGVQGTNALYHNNRDGTFTRVCTSPFTNDVGDFGAAGWGDYDNDGHPDLVVAVYSLDGRARNPVYHNNGDGTFTTVTNTIALTSNAALATAWADYDSDGQLDLFVSTEMTPEMPLTNFLFHNDGGGAFTRITAGDVVEDGGSQGAAWADYDTDGDLDLFVSNNGREFIPSLPYANNLFYLNEGNGNLVRQNLTNLTTDPGIAHGCAWGDYDNDGWLDLFVPQYSLDGRPRSLLYRNNRDGTFTRIPNGPIVTDIGDSIAGTWGDYDNDGHLDLFVSNRSTQRNFLYHNNGDGTFTKITTGAPVTDSAYSFDCVWGDYDNDGFLDLFVATGGNRQRQANFLYRNNGNTNSWVVLKLVGTVSNRSAIWAKVRLRATLRGQTVWQLREISGGQNFGSQNDSRAHFGLGDATSADLVRIEWPLGIVQELTNVAANQILTITEPAQLVPESAGRFQIQCWINQSFEVEASTDLASWSTVATATNTAGTLVFEDAEAGQHESRYYRVVAR